MEVQLSKVKLQINKGDIVAQNDIEAVVNAANAQLETGGGVAGAIHRGAGSELIKECRPLAPISPGEAVITGAYELPNKFIIHTLGPVYGQDKPEAELLKKSYLNSLKLAEKNKIKSIAFPAISTGAFGYPTEEAAKISLKAIKNYQSELKSIKLIRFVLYSSSDFAEYREAAEKYLK